MFSMCRYHGRLLPLLPMRHGRFNITFSFEEDNDCSLDPIGSKLTVHYGRYYKTEASNGYTNYKKQYWVCQKQFSVCWPHVLWPYRWFINSSSYYNQLHFDYKTGKPDPKYIK